MLKVKGFACSDSTSPLIPFEFQRRNAQEHDVVIEILYSGVCHSDIHTARNEWKGTVYPVVPGHEIVGRVTAVGSKVSKFKVDDLAGVGCFVDSCRMCESCEADEEQFCEKHTSFTYNSTEQDGKTRTYGGYSSSIVVNEDYVLKISAKLKLANVAPLLCAGITTYSPLSRHKVGPGMRVGVVGLGGLGHMAVKFSVAMGAHVTVFSTSPSKHNDALELGAHEFVLSSETEKLNALTNKFDLILDAVSADHDVNMYLNLLKRGGSVVLVGVPEDPLKINAFSVIGNRRHLTGSLIGGIKETQTMLDYCAEHNITSDVELISMAEINEAYTRMIKGDVRYRFVIDMKTL